MKSAYLTFECALNVKPACTDEPNMTTHTVVGVVMYFFLPHPHFKPHAPHPTHLRVTYVNFSAEFLTAREKHIFIIQRRPHYTTYWFPPTLPSPWQWLRACTYVWTTQRRLNTGKEFEAIMWAYQLSAWSRHCGIAHTRTDTHARTKRDTQTQQGAHCLGIKLGFPFKSENYFRTVGLSPKGCYLCATNTPREIKAANRLNDSVMRLLPNQYSNPFLFFDRQRTGSWTRKQVLE